MQDFWKPKAIPMQIAIAQNYLILFQPFAVQFLPLFEFLLFLVFVRQVEPECHQPLAETDSSAEFITHKLGNVTYKKKSAPIAFRTVLTEV